MNFLVIGSGAREHIIAQREIIIAYKEYYESEEE